MGTRLHSIINSGSIKPATARIELEDRAVEVGPGNYLDIPAHRKHCVAWTTPDEPAIWLAVHYGHSSADI
jgi:mannose-6-phosphate isomerase-like protein (cupin superfamily)